MWEEGAEDPYCAIFACYASRKSPKANPESSVLSDREWRSFLTELANLGLLENEMAARFMTDYHGARSFLGFQEQLAHWALPHDDYLRSMGDALEALEDTTALVERMTTSHNSTKGTEASTPPFVPRALARIRYIGNALDEAATMLQRQVHSRATHARLFGAKSESVDTEELDKAAAGSRSTTDAWRFQRDHQTFLLREERRLRSIRLERHTTDAASRQVLLQSFDSRLAGSRDICVTMGSATMPHGGEHAGDLIGSSKQELVVVLSMQRRHARSDEVIWLDTLVTAHRELVLSPYFQQYLGCHEVASPDQSREDRVEQLHCFELASVTTLEELLLSNGELFGDDSLLLRYFLREILLAMIDLHEQSTHRLRERVTATNVLVSPSRRRVLLGKLEFGPPLDPLRSGVAVIDDFTAEREAALLGDLALIVFGMLYQTTIPSNMHAFRRHYLARSSHRSLFVSEYLVVKDTLALRVNKDDRLSLLLLLGVGTSWRLESNSPHLDIWEQCAAPVPTFTIVATHPGSHRLDFVPLTRSSSSTTRVVVNLVVNHQSYLLDPPSQMTTLITSCNAAASCSLSLRRLFDDHVLFQPLCESQMESLDSALEKCQC